MGVNREMDVNQRMGVNRFVPTVAIFELQYGTLIPRLPNLATCVYTLSDNLQT